jgi:hypothetical protein
MGSLDLPHAAWRKSSFSANGGNCVEVAAVASTEGNPRAIVLRDSKDPRGPALRFTPDVWQAFATGVKNGEFDLA